ncbi:ethanolamine ammonia-lyase reactivating factor EutA [Bacillus sp. 03113]|uniref:ethanolamine ammonia-lyase reactivating factor EutA n=1 Tax=Bacillus sp. 03113 TaxID=2578211 RepID=UPI0011413C01|nr:ethanolamine ammonia-lyase reactivating factor EutA [Bacillus sp. 03113]
MADHWITSIGLDIGTSTTKFIVSHLHIGEQGDRFSLPKCQIVDRKIIYASPIYTTPLKNEFEIDMDQLAKLLTKEYERSCISLKDVKAGAVIITGETAQKENAQTIIHYLADRAGDFVVATAGANLEGILAGKGSGAMQRSKKTEGIVANVDIGGGTANVALFQHGRAIQTFTFHIGGRLIRLKEDGEIQYISKHIKPWLKTNHFNLQIGGIVTYEELKELTLCMNESMLSYLIGSPQFDAQLLLFEPPAGSNYPIDEILISGGIGQMMNEQTSQIKEVTKYGDMGPLLASTLKEAVQKYIVHIKKAAETTRATVIGAGMQNTEVSGATVYVDESLLPLKNIPLVTVSVEEHGKWDSESFHFRLQNAMIQAKKLYDEKQDPPFAVALSSIKYCTYIMLQSLAQSLYDQFKTYFPDASKLVVICENDMAKALGQALAKRSQQRLHVICVDQVDFTYGDYIDLGLPVAKEAISISIKTLAF